MPRIDTTNVQAIDEILEVSGVKQAKETTLNAKLKANRLDVDSILSVLGDITHNTESDITRLQAVTKAMQLNSETREAMNDERTKQVPTVNIIINDSRAVNLNPILLPREITQ